MHGPCLRQSGLPVRRLAHDVHVVGTAHERGEPGTDQRLVVDEQHADAHARLRW